jgi:hypothetical protein
MPNKLNPRPSSDLTSAPGSTAGQSHAPLPAAHDQPPAKDYPGEHTDDSTVKNPKTPETSGASRADRAANKAAHKAAKDEQESEKENPIFSR